MQSEIKIMLLQQELIINNQPYLISTDKSKLQLAVIADYLINQSYWASTRTVEQIKTSIEHSMCFAVYNQQKQIAFGRVISDCSTFAYLADVFVLEPYRKQGISKALMQFMLAHPQLQNLRRFILATKDAHSLYAQFGFKPMHWTDRWMEIYAPTVDDTNQ